jgi:hypothetical protein
MKSEPIGISDKLAFNEPPLEQLNRWLALLEDLRQTLEQAKIAIVTNDLVEIERTTAWQKEICAQISSCALVDFPGHAVSEGLSSGSEETWNDAIQRLGTTIIEIHARNEMQAALLRRVQRTARIFALALSVSGATYPCPRPEAATLSLSWGR